MGKRVWGIPPVEPNEQLFAPKSAAAPPASGVPSTPPPSVGPDGAPYVPPTASVDEPQTFSRPEPELASVSLDDYLNDTTVDSPDGFGGLLSFDTAPEADAVPERTVTLDTGSGETLEDLLAAAVAAADTEPEHHEPGTFAGSMPVVPESPVAELEPEPQTIAFAVPPVAEPEPVTLAFAAPPAPAVVEPTPAPPAFAAPPLVEPTSAAPAFAAPPAPPVVEPTPPAPPVSSAPAPTPTSAPAPSADEPRLLSMPGMGGSGAHRETVPQDEPARDELVFTHDAKSHPDVVAALAEVVYSGASDLHVASDAMPMIRIDGGLHPLKGSDRWSPDRVRTLLLSLIDDEQRSTFEEKLELDFAYELAESARFRVNFYMDRGNMGAAFRIIPTRIRPLHELGVQETVADFAGMPRGLVLVTGPTGSGKSTTLAALIDLANRTRADHIVTVEDPIEFLHENKRSLVNQREVGRDTHSFQNALKHVLRQDPDIILIGELRDLETISIALTAAETGHLVFATLHTQDAAQTIDRVIDVFPPHQQGQVRTQLAAVLQGVVCQTLVRRASGKGRVVATEVMVMTPAIGNLIREGKIYQIPSTMQAGKGLGMHTMDQHLASLANAGAISDQAAMEKAHDGEGMKRLLSGANTDGRPTADPAYLRESH